jgi:hypothetical protein
MYTVTTPNLDSDGPRGIIPFSTVFATGQYENAIAPNAEAGKCSFALFTHVSMYGHEVFPRIHKDDP